VRLAVFASGEGTTLAAIARECISLKLSAKIVLVVGNNRESGALRRAQEFGLPFRHLSSLTHPVSDELDATILAELVLAKAEVVVLAGYMKKIGPKVLDAYAGRIINTHPALLPKFGGQGMFGHRVHVAVLEAGETVTGVSVHLVTEEYDAGPVIAQIEVPVLPGDNVESLAARVQVAEREFLVDTLRGVASGKRILIA
jgi:phosphoribosylglycinamide formyltransferase 1